MSAESMMIGGTAMSAMSSVTQGNALKKQADFEAGQMDQKAGQTVAEGLQAAKEERRQAMLLKSRAVALNAAGGGSGADVSTNKIISDIAGEGEYRALTKMFQAKETAAYYKDSANAKRYEGKQAKKAYIMEGIGTALKGGSDWYKNYGGKAAQDSVAG
jgi:hypothetical protein